MKTILLVFCLFTGFGVNAESRHGDPMPGKGEPISLSVAIDQETAVPQKIEGQITEVCQKKGCFMVLTDGQSFARVTFKDYGFFVPMDSSMRDAVVFGTLTRKVLSAEQANHYEADSGREGRFTGEVTEYSIIASSVVIL